MIELPIGVFDSGVGGLTVVRALRAALPHEDIIYLGDTARVPYGTKSPSTVVRFACEDTQFLLERHVKAVVVACNTCSAWAIPLLSKGFNVPVFGVIQPGVNAALRQSRNQRIGIIGTAATIRSNAYSNGILAQSPSANVFAKATPLLVPLVEEGWLAHKVTSAVLREYLTLFARKNVDTMILGCTHYPLLKKNIRRSLGKRVTLIDSAEACANDVKERLASLQMLTSRRRAGTVQCFVTDETERFYELARRFLGCEVEQAQRVELAAL